MPIENWEKEFRKSLVGRAHAAAADLGQVDVDAAERADLFVFMLSGGLYCPECWVRYGQAVTLHRARWLMSCGEHDYKVD